MRIAGLFIALVLSASTVFAADQPWLTFEGAEGKPGNGKHVVLISGDEEYRSEEALPQLAKILSQHHGFKTTVLFAIDPKTGEINPQDQTNIPGLEALKEADLMIMFLRFRNLSDEQMKLIEDYVKAGKPIIAMRTSTHPFQVPPDRAYAHWNWKGGEGEWTGGFGKQIFGETWVAHHGKHKHEATRGLIAPGAQQHPIVRGIKSGEIWGSTDVYTVNLPLPGDSKALVLGQVLQRKGEFDERDVDFGMRPTDPALAGKKNDPMMPIAWIKSYQYPGADSRGGATFVTTMGSAADLMNQAFRRLLVNATYYFSELPVPAEANVDLVGDYKPSQYGFKGHAKGRKPADYR